MDSLLHWIANGLAGLFFVACVVAWWEHLGRGTRYRPEDVVTPRPPAKVDITLDDLPAASTASGHTGDTGERRDTLAGALTRMVVPAAKAGWPETAPMVLPGRAEARPEKRTEPTPSQM